MASIEKNLAVRLELIADFARATRTARENLNQIVTGIEEVKAAGKSFDLGGLNTLGREISGFTGRVGDAKRRVDDLGASAAGAGSRAAAAARDYRAAATSVDGLGAAAGRARQEVLRLSTSLTGIDVVAVNRVGSAFAAWRREIAGVDREITGIGQAIQELTGREHTIRMRVVYDAPVMNRALPPQQRYAALPPAYGSQYGPIPSRPSAPVFGVLGSSPQYALPPGYSSNYGPIPQPASRPSRSTPLPSAPLLMLPGSTDPNFNSRAWWANQRARGSTSGGGPTIPVPPDGFGAAGGGGGGGFGGRVFGMGRGMMTAGNAIQGAGWAGVVNAAMISAALVPLLKQVTDLEDLFRRTYEALRSGGATDKNAQLISQGIANVAKTTKGADFRDTASAGYNFFSSLPATAKFNLNDPAQQKMLLGAYRQIVKMQVAGSSSTHPISMETATLDTLATATNLGFDMSTPQKAAAAIKKTADILINLKNRTSTEVDLAATSFRNIGPIAANQGINPEEVVGLVAAEAEGKIRGGPAGNNLKRILSRQALTPKKLAQMQKIVAATGGNISMYDKDGNVRNMFDFITDIGAFEKKFHLPSKQRAQVEGLLSGLYAGPGLGEMVRFGQQIGGSEGFKKFAHDIYNNPPAGAKPGESPTDTAHRQRTEGNVKSEFKTTDAKFLDEARDTFKLIEPDLIKVLHAVNGIIEAFHALPGPVKKGLVEFVGLTTIASGVAGVAGVLIGNFVKFGGALLEVGGFAIGAAQKIMQFGGAFRVAIPFVSGLISAVGIVPIAIAAVVASVVLFGVAWARDWGHIREKTAAVVGAIGTAIKDIPKNLGFMVGASVMWLARMQSNWDAFWRDFPRNAYNAITNTIAFLTNSIPKWVAAGKQMLVNFGKGIVDAIPQVASAIVTAVKNTGGFLAKLAGDAIDAGKKTLSQYADGIEAGAKANKPRIQAAIKKTVSDQLPHSPPADPSSPLHGLTEAGRTTADMYVAGLIDALATGGATKHKKALKKAVTDVIIQTRAEAVSEVIKTAQAMEAALSRAGATLQRRGIDLVGANGVTRVTGDPRAYRAAVSQNRTHKTNYNQQAADYLRKMLDAGVNEASIGPIISHLKELEKKAYDALDAHAVERIDHYIHVIEAAAQKAQAKKQKALENLMRPFFGDPKTQDKGLVARLEKDKTSESDLFSKFGNTQSKYDEKINNYISIRKDREAPTVSELRRELTLEINEREALASVLKEEENRRRTLSDDVLHLKLLMDNLNDADKDQHDLKVRLIPILQQYQGDLRDVNDQMTYQQGVIDQVNAKVKDYEKNLQLAATGTTAWQKALDQAFKAGVKAAVQTGETELSNGIDKMLQRVLGSNGKKGPLFQSMLASFLGNFFKKLLGDIFDKMFLNLQSSLTGFFGKMMGGGGGILGAVFGGGAAAAGATSGSGKPVPVTLQPQGGGATDLGQVIAESTQKTASDTASSAVDKTVGGVGGMVGGGGSKTADPVSTVGKAARTVSQGAKTMQTIMRDIAGAGMAYQGFTQGGLGGAIETYAGVSSLFSGGAAGARGAGPYIAAAAAIFTLLHKQPDPKNMPDLYQAGYGQFVSNLNGAPGTFGHQVVGPEQPFDRSAGNKDLAQQLWDFVSNPGATQGLGDAQKSIISQLKALGPDLGIAHEANDVFTLGSGKTIGVEAYESLIDQAKSIMQSQQGALQQQQQNADALASSFTSLVLGGPAGFSGIPYLLGGGGDGRIGSLLGGVGDGRSVLPGRRGSVGGGGSSGGGDIHITVSIMEGANVTGDPETINQTIDSALPRIVSAVQRAGYKQARLYGNYVSAVG